MLTHAEFSRCRIREDGGRIYCNIGPAKGWLIAAFLLVWTCYSMSTIREVFHRASLPVRGSVVHLAYGGGLLVGSALAVWTIIWQFVGTEQIVIDHRGLSVTSSLVLPVRRRLCALSSIGAVTLFPIDAPYVRLMHWTPVPFHFGAGSVLIEANNKRIRFGKCLSRADAQRIVVVVRRCIEAAGGPPPDVSNAGAGKVPDAGLQLS